MQIYLYPLNSLNEVQSALQQGCKQVTLFDATSQPDWQAVVARVNGSDALGLVQFAQDYFSLTNYALMYEIDEGYACESTGKGYTGPGT